MALINCPECGNRISDKAMTCPTCGYPIKQRDVPEKRAKPYIWLCIGILLIFLSLFVAYQSFFAGILNVVTASGGIDGTIGLSFALVSMATGIITIVTHKSSSIAFSGAFGTATILIGFLYGYLYNGIYEDLNILARIYMLMCLVLMISGYYVPGRKDVNKRESAPNETKTPKQNKSVEERAYVSSTADDVIFFAISTAGVAGILVIIIAVLYRVFINPI